MDASVACDLMAMMILFYAGGARSNQHTINVIAVEWMLGDVGEVLQSSTCGNIDK